ncbi:hypothetical protein PV416_24385 [Streptomyces ipomoeae]|jgi:hypothetical protein|uniref:hypothetical protein n=2 Tax=Streptomyces ipomoeae TaxID=103232 RepID=UPI000662ACDB|nr:hypothetical protein [Streptomyces ipomoeae]MDX2698794.1 hypothetical protein [Streptomyces ipomoeae]MDX2824151.1 hypothetical protein [Streptomyces ipomoeae]MDX2840220.1 hypothetical protein [Streptomyces ipomoeae]MDX2879979.1 hypothetical protein [Streptomyces ipomoeae]
MTESGDLPVLDRLVFVVRLHQVNIEPHGEEGFELPVSEALVGQDHLPGSHEAAQGSGVESISRRLSCQVGPCRVSILIT